MLKQRIITAAILIPIVVALLFYLPPYAFLVVTGVFFLAAAYEFTSLMQLRTPLQRVLYVAVMLGVMLLSSIIPAQIILTLGFCWWIIALMLVSRYERGKPRTNVGIFMKGVMGVMLLVPCWVALNYIRNENEGIITLLYVFVLIWGADSAAYFVGKKWGKTKLSPKVSPGKSVQGAIGAVIFAIILTTIAAAASHSPTTILIDANILAVATVLFSILGDLFESMLKRQVNLKDSGNILPGHGGLLDRIDSLTAAVPIYAYGCLQLSIFFS
jgi:phosphatidate cytidylyltransferase